MTRFKPIETCPACGEGVLKIVDSRPDDTSPDVIKRRRRNCLSCGYKCSTHEVIVADDLGLANGHVRRLRNFLERVEQAAREEFTPEEFSSAVSFGRYREAGQ